MKKIILLAFFYTLNIQCQVSDNPYPGYRFSNFDDSPAYNLANAVNEENINTITEIISSNPELINVKESKFGMTLLCLTIANDKREAFKALIANGANVNEICGKFEKTTPLITAIEFLDDCDAFFVNELLKNNCDVNLKVISTNEKGSVSENLPLFVNLSCLEVSKILIEKGADLNSTIKFPPYKKTFSLIDVCLMYKELDFLYYLINVKNIEIPEEIELEKLDGITKKNLVEYLKSEEFNLPDSSEFQNKRKKLIKLIQQKQNLKVD